MPSPPLVPDDGPIDLEHLARMTLGDARLEREVLAMFAGQSAHLIDALAALPAEAGALAHTLKGSARAIGAFRVAECAEASGGCDQAGEIRAKCQIELKAAVAEARARSTRCCAVVAAMSVCRSALLASTVRASPSPSAGRIDPL